MSDTTETTETPTVTLSATQAALLNDIQTAAMDVRRAGSLLTGDVKTVVDHLDHAMRVRPSHQRPVDFLQSNARLDALLDVARRDDVVRGLLPQATVRNGEYFMAADAEPVVHPLATLFPDDLIDDVMSDAGRAIAYWAKEPDWSKKPAGAEFLIAEQEPQDEDKPVYGLTRDDLRDAIALLAGPTPMRLSRRIRHQWTNACWFPEPDGRAEMAEVDDEGSDVLVQVALFGDVVYG